MVFPGEGCGVPEAWWQARQTFQPKVGGSVGGRGGGRQAFSQTLKTGHPEGMFSHKIIRD